jgi:hypothetical protein
MQIHGIVPVMESLGSVFREIFRNWRLKIATLVSKYHLGSDSIGLILKHPAQVIPIWNGKWHHTITTKKQLN